jgi:SRSO17 transposase
MHSLAPHEHSYPHLWHMPSTRHQTLADQDQYLARTEESSRAPAVFLLVGLCQVGGWWVGCEGLVLPVHAQGEQAVGGLTPTELAAIRGRLEAFADDVFASLARTDQRARGECYLRGLMLDGRRKSIQPMAQRLGEAHYQALHHFVAVSPWDWRPVRRRLAEVLCAALQPTAWVVDDTGFPKDGTHSVGVQRQYSGTLGKTANCQLGVSVNAVTEQASCPLDWRLFLPQRWDEEAMAPRRAACHLPKQVHHRPKWQLVLDMLDELAGWELSPPVLLADSGYGEVGAFRGGLDTRQVSYVVEVRSDTSPTLSRCAPVSRRTRAGAGVPGRATATSRPRSRSWPPRPGSRPVWS